MKTASLILGILLSLPFPAAAATVGLVIPKDCIFGADVDKRFLAALVQAGVPADSVTLALQRPAPDKVSRLNSIRKLIAYEADLIVIWGSTGVREAAQEAPRSAILYVGAYDPAKAGLINDAGSSLPNVAGISSQTSIPFLLDAVAETSGPGPLGVIFNSDNIDSTAQLEAVQGAAPKKGFSVVPVDAKAGTPEALAGALATTRFVYLASGCFLKERASDMAKVGKPIATQSPGLSGNGIVFSLAPAPEDLLNEAARMAAAILKGAKPGSLPLSSVKKVEFAIDVTEAQRLDVKVPFSVLSRATRVVK